MNITKKQLMEDIEFISKFKNKQKYIDLLSQITELLISEEGGRLEGAKMVREYKTKNLTIKVFYGT